MEPDSPIGRDRPVAIVTGAGSGIGRQTAEQLAAANYAVVVAARTHKPLSELESSITAAGGEALAVVADVARDADLAKLVQSTLDRFGRIDALVNNAGRASLHDIDAHNDALLDALYAVNALGPAKLIARVWRPMIEAGGGAIVNVSTYGTQSPFPGFFGYAAAKAATNVMAKSIATEGAEHGIRGFAVAPGAVETPMLRSMFDQSALPTSSCLTPEDVARVIVECVQGNRDHQNGETIFIQA